MVEKEQSLVPTYIQACEKYFSLPGTSVPSERTFSKAGQLVSEKRNRLKANHVNRYVSIFKQQFTLMKQQECGIVSKISNILHIFRYCISILSVLNF